MPACDALQPARGVRGQKGRNGSLGVPFSHGRHPRPELAGAVGDDASTDPVENEENDDGAANMQPKNASKIGRSSLRLSLAR